MLPFSCLLASACDKYRKITPGTVQKNWGISLSILPGLSTFSCHFLRSKYIYRPFTFSWIFCWSSHWCERRLGHPCWPWMAAQCMVPEHPAWHRAEKTSEERSHRLAPSTGLGESVYTRFLMPQIKSDDLELQIPSKGVMVVYCI